jgi:TonB family protein
MLRIETSTRTSVRAIVVLAAILMGGLPGAGKAQATASQAAGTGGVLTGVVRDSLGSAVAGARISAGSTVVITDSSGAFTMRGLTPGALTLTVRRLGFEPLSSLIILADAPLSVDLRVRPVGRLLPAVRVRARSEPYESRLAGFNARRAKKLGYYITRDEIEKRNDFSMTAALRRIPGVQPYTMRGALGRTVRLPGSACPPLVFVDGFPASLGSFDLDMIDLAGVEGVEVFAGPYGSESCGVIAIWSLPFRRRRVADTRATTQDVAAQVDQGLVYLSDRVDVQAQFVASSAEPAYPDSLLRTLTAGRVVAQFVVDTAGRIESGSVTIVSSTNAKFAAAVRDVLPSARFEPARRQGRVVRELISLPFEFDPRAVTPNTSHEPQQP